MKKRLLYNTGSLVASNIIVRLLGLLYRIWLSRAISNTALGVYQLGMSVYGLLVTLSASGLPNSLSRISAGQFSRRNGLGARETARSALNFAYYIAFFCTLFMLLTNRLMAGAMLHDVSAWPVILALIPAVIFGGLGAVPVGFLHAQGRSYISAFAEVAEQIAKIAFVVLTFRLFSLSGQGGVMAALMGVGAGSAVSFILIRLSLGKLPGHASKKTNHELFEAALPLTGSRLLGAGLQLLTAVLVPARLMAAGFTRDGALADYGILTGMSLPLMLLPHTVTSAICVVMLPNISKLHAAGQNIRMKKRIGQAFLIVLGVSTFLAVLLFVFAPQLAAALYKNQQAGLYMQYMAPLTALSGIYAVAATVINALGYEKKTFQLGLLGGGCQLALTFWLCATRIGIAGFVLANTAQVLVCLITSFVMLRNIYAKIDKTDKQQAVRQA